MLAPRAFRCACGRPVFFRNSQCLACGAALGYDPERGQLLAMTPLPAAPGGQTPVRWRAVGPPGERMLGGARMYRRCAHLNGPAGCNWLIPWPATGAAPPALCRCCRLVRTLPDLADVDNARYWAQIARALRRLVSLLILLGLPLQSRLQEDTEAGLAFDLLRAPPGEGRVQTGHSLGVITLDVEEADDALREQRRHALHEPYRTLLGHLRHESGHYYWMRLVQLPAGQPWLAAFRAVFGDERDDYLQALGRHYQQGPPADWPLRHVGAYASCHPWEDWAETWAHYLHLRDTLDTAASFGLQGQAVELEHEPFTLSALQVPAGQPASGPWDCRAADADELARRVRFLGRVNDWVALSAVLNELSRSMGLPDFYPFVLSASALRKLYLVQRVMGQGADSGGAGRRSA